MTTILITGASGFVGQYLVPACLQGVKNAVVHAWCFHRVSDFSPEVTTATVDLLNCNQVKCELEKIQPDVIIHLAGQSSITKSFDEPVQTFQQNTMATLNLFEACRLVSPRSTVFLVSSGDVYGHAASKGILTEATIPEPLNFYSTSKLSAELIAKGYQRNFDIKAIILRPFNHIGAGQPPSFAISSFASQIAKLERSANASSSALAVGNIQVERDILSVRDVVSAYVALINKHASLENGCIIHICAGVSQSIAAVLEKLCSLSTIPVTIQVDPSRIRAHDIVKIHASNQKLRELCPEWTVSADLMTTLQEIMTYYRTHE